MRRAAAALAACLAAGAAAAQSTASMADWLAQTYGAEILSSFWFQGPAGADGSAPGLSVAYYPIPGGNSFQIGVDAFAVTAAGAVHRGEIEGLYGTEPRDPAFGDGVMTLTTTMPKPDDPRCCPTGATRWTIDLNALKVVAETPLP
jgi:hypothetical protein